MSRSRALVGAAIAAVLLGACLASTTPTPPPAASAGPTAPGPSGPSPSAVASSPAASPTDSPTASPTPTPPPPTLTAKDRAHLLAALRADAGVHCAAEKTAFPTRAESGMACPPSAKGVAGIDVFGFASEDDALQTYLERLAAIGVAQGTGDCHAGTPGEKAWPDYLEDLGRPTRAGCYVDASGIAHMAVTCYHGILIDIVGKDAGIVPLYKFAWQYPAGQSKETRDPPGICAQSE